MNHHLGFIHRYLPSTTPGAPAVLLLHGTGGDENDLVPLGQGLLPHATLLSPRGKVLEGGMPRFFRRLSPGVFDLEDLRARTDELAGFVTASSAAYGHGPRVIALGYSNGANIAASLLLRRPDLLIGAVLFHPMVPFVPAEAPDLRGIPVFIGAGRADAMVPPRETERLAALLMESGAEVTTYWQPGGHALGQEEVEAARTWLASLPAADGRA